jgi:16S rRNA (uracil1498-N3)-methyltransferase
VNLVLINKEESIHGIPIEDPRAVHLTQTVGLNLKKTFFVGIKNEFRGLATITEINQRLVFTVTWEKEKQSNLPLELLVGLPRPQTAKKILYEAASLGLKKICFFVSEKGDPGYLSSSLWKNNEWEDSLLNGAEQACSCLIPEVVHAKSLAEGLKLITPDSWRVSLDPYTAESPLFLNNENFLSGTLAIGSERGWSDSERILLKNNQFVTHHLGDRILRVESACLAGSAIMLSHLNAWRVYRPIL